MNRKQLIKKYIDFFKSKNHKEIPNASLIPENDPTTLFIGSGMETIIPFLLGEKHPQGKRLVNVQKCIRTQDIEEVGDSYHHTFFEMIGNWSLGDYFKEDAIKMTFEFLTKTLDIPIERLAASCFKGNKSIPKDSESEKVYLELGFPKKRIAFLDEKSNLWGPVGSTGPCGPNTEIFYWEPKDIKAPEKFDPEDKRWLEIGNNVLMSYNKNKKGDYEELKQKNIDFGGGVERTIAVLNNLEDNYLTDCWKPIIQEIEHLSGKKYGENKRITRHIRIIADHIKASVMILAEGILPGNAEQGYVLRRLIRRAIRYCYVLGIKNKIKELTNPVFLIYSDYKKIHKNKDNVIEEFEKEEKIFEKTLEEGLKKAKKILGNKIPLTKEKNEKIRNANKSIRLIIKELLENKKKGKSYSFKIANISEKEVDNSLINGKEGFLLYQSYGFPQEMILELSVKERLLFDEQGFELELKKHQTLSRTASAGKFKSGLADDSEATTRLHTATHLLLAGLKKVLKNPDIEQRGSNINSERARFDFTFYRKLTDEEVKKVEDFVNKIIKDSIPVQRKEMTIQEAKKQGATGIFDEKYKEKVSVYTIKDVSKEICAGPHVNNTSELGKFKIKKQESSSSGVRRIKAVLE